DWWTMPWCWTAGRLDDGLAFHAFRPLLDVPYASGFVLANNGDIKAVERFSVETDTGDEQLPVRARMRLDELDLAVTPAAHAPVLLEADDGRVSRFPRSLCRFETGDGREAWGWTEWCRPPPGSGCPDRSARPQYPGP